MRKGLFFLASVFALLLLSACGNRDVALVKDSYLEGFKTTTIGQALEDFQYFQEKEWVEKKLDNGTREVIFTGTLKPEFYTKGCDLLDKENLASVKGVFHIYKLHFQLVFFYFFKADVKGFFLIKAVLLHLFDVLFCCHPLNCL